MREELLRKQNELIELQKHKLKLEMLQQHRKERKQIHVNPELVNILFVIIFYSLIFIFLTTYKYF